MHGHEQHPRRDLSDAEEPGEERDTWIVWTCDERVREDPADRRGGDERIAEGRHLLQVLGYERGMNAGAEGDTQGEQPGTSGRGGHVACTFGSGGRVANDDPADQVVQAASEQLGTPRA